MATRAEAWVVGDGVERRRRRPSRYFASDWALGVDEPTRANTGPRVPETSLSNYAGDLTNVAAGEVLDRLIITGRFAPSNPSILRDSIIKGGPAPTYGTDHVLATTQYSGPKGVTRYEYVAIEPSHRSVDIYGFKWGGIDAYRCRVEGAVDAASVHGFGAWPNTTHASVKFHACAFGDTPKYAVDPRQSNGSHNDFMQVHGSLSLFEVIGCSFGSWGDRAAACILLQQNHGLYSGPVRITDNWFYGHKTEGAVFNMTQTRGQAYTMLSFHRNRIDPESNHASPSPVLVLPESRIPENFGMVGAVGSGPSTWTPGPDCNVYMDTGEYVPIKAG